MSAEPVIRRSATSLAAAIRSGELRSADVVEAHIEEVQRLEPSLGALVHDRFDAARREAGAADDRIAAAGERAEHPPLLGVPCTIKESIALEEMPNSAGVVARRDHRVERDAPTVARLRAAGAIPIGVTNTSELTLWVESVNRVYGRTNNAYDPARTAGGSSGGEGAMVGAGGSPIGLGSDIGGSIRLPAFFNGVFGHKCSTCLVPNSGQWPTADGDSARMLAIGPITRHAEDLMPVLRAIAGPDASDPRTRDAPLGDPSAVAIEGLEVVVSDGASVLPVARELLDARERAAGALQAAGARVRHEPMRSIRRAMEYYLATMSLEAEDIWALLGGTPGTRAPLGRIAREVARGRGHHTPAILVLLAVDRIGSRLPAGRMHKAVQAGRALAREVEGVIGDGVLLHPSFPRVAPVHNRTVGRPWMLLPVAVFNLMGLPATQIPLGLNGDGLPLGVQAVAGRDRDHVSIAVALELERAFGGWVPPSARR